MFCARWGWTFLLHTQSPQRCPSTDATFRLVGLSTFIKDCMKQIFLLIFVIAITQLSCRRSDPCTPPASLDGKWRMIIVKDNTSSALVTKPAAVTGDVDIVFTSSGSTIGTFRGNTPTNDIEQNDYSIGPNQSLTIPNLSMTKVGETSWGKEFVDNIRSSTAYNFENCDKLNIKTVNKTLTFQKQ